MNYTVELRSMASLLDAAIAQNLSSAALIRVLALKLSLASDDWRTWLADVRMAATLDIESMPVPALADERRAAIREAAAACLAASLDDLGVRLSSVPATDFEGPLQ